MIVEFAEYKELLGVKGDDAAFDSTLLKLIIRVEGRIRAYVGRTLEAADYVEEFDGEDSNFLDLGNYPVNSIAKIEYWDGTQWIALVEGSDYTRALARFGLLTLQGYKFREGISNYRVSFNAGFTPEKMPADIKGIAQDLLQIAFDNSSIGGGRLGLKSKSSDRGQGSSSSSFAEDTEDKILERLNTYKILNV